MIDDYLLDTNVISEFSRSTAAPNANVLRWLRSAREGSLHISVLSLGEIRKGIDLLTPGKKRAELEVWFKTDLYAWFGHNLLDVNKAISHRWGVLSAECQRRGRPLGNVDGLIAATALEHRLSVVTRNTRHFLDLGVTVLDPWHLGI